MNLIHSVRLATDGSHTPCKNGADAVGYQGRKVSNTTNALFVSDNQGIMPAMSTPQKGQPHDLFQIQTLFKQICVLLKQAAINLEGLFLNADPGFDSLDFRKACEKEQNMANVKLNLRSQAKQLAQDYQKPHTFLMSCFTGTDLLWTTGFTPGFT